MAFPSDDELERQQQMKKLRELDEAETFITTTFPRMWRRLYKRCLEEGFSEQQALELVKTHILAQSPGGVRG